MNREQAINYLISSGFTHEQVGEVVRALTYEPTTKKDCNTCTHSNEIDGSNCYECVKDMCNNYDPTTKKDLGVEEVTALAEWTTAYSQGYADGVKSVNICPYCGEYIGEEE